MSAWQEINRVFKDADDIEYLAKLYMERGNVTWQEALAWVAEMRRLYAPTPQPPRS